jgi:hypothetical protein
VGNLVKRGLLAIVGLALTLAWWSIRGGGSGGASQEGIPARVWNGGGGSLTVEVETTCPAKMSIGFNERKNEGAKSLETWERVEAGSRSWTVDVPPAAGGYIELGAIEPKVGDRLKWKVSVNGRVIDEQTETLEEALKPGYAFFIQLHLEDYGQAKPEEEAEG